MTIYGVEPERVFRYVERAFARSGETEFPTVRQVARRFNVRQAEVEMIVDEDERLFLTYFNAEEEAPLGDWFVGIRSWVRNRRRRRYTVSLTHREGYGEGWYIEDVYDKETGHTVSSRWVQRKP